ncbi:hypothetical protein [Clostridium sporogenes]|uniref:Uncharacterized protein n=1 Tax=Clostridium sporogenes TaxID=1509 RepID=A0A1L3NFB6_CLOSG|nr:hypothetical protein [Clostridium sporogenes]APH14809.1 hypothetical protein NPD5_3704 [Clostridium sporogenes]
MNNKIIKPSILPGFMELLPREQIISCVKFCMLNKIYIYKY